MDQSTRRIRHFDSMRQAFLWALISSMALFLIAPAVSLAQVVTDIEATTTPLLGLGTDVTTVGTITEITGGTRPGNGTNLFHSFDSFTLGTDDVAHFMNDMMRPTTNIIARVSGEQSTIDGTLRTNNPLNAEDPMNFGGANLWLVNPSGVLLGPNARVDVGGSVSFSTANYLRFDGTSPTLFDMLSTPASLGALDVEPVVAFGFTGPELPAPITVQGSMLQVPEGKALSLVGGDLTVQSGTLVDGTTVQTASLLAPGGQLNLVSVASPGEVVVPSFQTDSFTAMGTVTIKEGSRLDVSGRLDEFGTPIGNGNSGTVLVRGGQLVMNASTILATTVGALDGASKAVDIQVLQDVTFSNRSVIVTRTSGPGRVGDVQITTDRLTLENRSRITTTTSEFGVEGGDLVLNVGRLSLQGSGTLIRSLNTTGTALNGDGTVDAPGKGGNITVQGLLGMGSVAESVVLAGSSGITSDAAIDSGGGGQISVRAISLDLGEASDIASSTSAAETDLNGDGIVDTEEAIAARGGDIVVEVNYLKIVGSAAITSSTSLGDPTAAAGGTVMVQGLEGPESNASSVLLSGQSSGIVSLSGSGVPGNLTVHAERLTITDGAEISAGGSFSDGPAGDVTVTADSVVISADGQIFSRSFAQSSGQVTVTANNALTLDNGSIDTGTNSDGRGGDVLLDVRTGTVSLTNGASINSQSGSEDVPFSTGRAGDIIITAESLALANLSKITSSSKGTEVNNSGDAGNITIQSGSTVLLNDSSITTEAREASGGQITINAPEMIRLTNSEVSTSVKGVAGDSDGGNIMIDPQFVILQNSQLVAQANAGAGGAINVIAGVFIADPNSLVSASSQSGPQGTVNIQSPVQNVGGELAALSDEFASAAALLAQQCAARVADGKFSTFVIAGREGLPVEPGGFLASPSWMTELRGSRLSGRDQQTKLSAAMDLFPKYEVRPIQLAKFEPACHR